MEGLIAGARVAHESMLAVLSWTAWAAAASLFIPSVRARVLAWGAALEGAAWRRADAAAWAAGSAVASWFLFQKYLQFRGFQLPQDSTMMVNTAANFLAGHGLACTVDGTPSALSVHFAFFVPVFLGPVLLFWKSALPLLLIQSAAVSSLGVAAYLLAGRWSGSKSAGFIAMLLAYTHPSFHQLAGSCLENSVFGPALLLWGVVFWDRGRRWIGAALWALALTTREQFPFTLAGLGVYHALASSRPRGRRFAEGAAIVLGSAAVWFLEMRLVGSYADAVNASYWRLYAHFGANKEEIIRTFLTRPDRILGHILWPPSRLAPLGLLLAGVCFLPLAEPAGFAALIVASTHHLLQAGFWFELVNAAYTFGPLLFATACGLGALARRGLLTGPGRAWMAAAVLAAAGWSLRGASRVLHAELGIPYVNAAPVLADLVPDGASVWADEYVGCRLSARPQLKLISDAALFGRFEVLLFRPEYVLVDKGTLLFLPPEDQARVVGFLAREGYGKVAEAGTLVLLKDPQAPRPAPSPALSWPGQPAEAGRIESYLAGVLDSAQARLRLKDYPPGLRYEPESAEQELRFAQLLRSRGLPALAVRHARRAASLRPELAEAHGILADALAAASDAEGALGAYRAALAILPNSVPTLVNFGNQLLRAGKADEALRCYDRVLALEPTSAAVQANRGVALLSLGRRDEARSAFAAALRLDPGNALARRFLPPAGGTAGGDAPVRP